MAASWLQQKKFKVKKKIKKIKKYLIFLGVQSIVSGTKELKGCCPKPKPLPGSLAWRVKTNNNW